MKGNKFVFSYVHLFYYKINLNCGGSYIHSPDWIKNKKTTINRTIKNVTNVFNNNHEEIKRDPQRITKN